MQLVYWRRVLHGSNGLLLAMKENGRWKLPRTIYHMKIVKSELRWVCKECWTAIATAHLCSEFPVDVSLIDWATGVVEGVEMLKGFSIYSFEALLTGI